MRADSGTDGIELTHEQLSRMAGQLNVGVQRTELPIGAERVVRKGWKLRITDDRWSRIWTSASREHDVVCTAAIGNGRHPGRRARRMSRRPDRAQGDASESDRVAVLDHAIDSVRRAP